MNEDIKVTFEEAEDLKVELEPLQSLKIQYGELEIGTTTTGEAGTEATVTNSGSPTHAILNFTIPKGDKGEDGKTGANGLTPNIQVGTTTTLEAGSEATVTLTGTTENPILNFGIPKGENGVVTEYILSYDEENEELTLVESVGGV